MEGFMTKYRISRITIFPNLRQKKGNFEETFVVGLLLIGEKSCFSFQWWDYTWKSCLWYQSLNSDMVNKAHLRIQTLEHFLFCLENYGKIHEIILTHRLKSI